MAAIYTALGAWGVLGWRRCRAGAVRRDRHKLSDASAGMPSSFKRWLSEVSLWDLVGNHGGTTRETGERALQTEGAKRLWLGPELAPAPAGSERYRQRTVADRVLHEAIGAW